MSLRNVPTTLTLDTPRLILRAAQPEDAHILHAMFSDPEVMKWQVSAVLDTPLSSVTNVYPGTTLPLSGRAKAKNA